ncbi:MAG: hypothetical protein KDA25_12025, partial [Phycisphaerales bacterium]|nr:hypothetical protein [Phycisphaerales bacterium]
HESGSRVVVLLADGMLRCAMYDSAAAFRSGWKRIFIEACKRKPARLRKHAWRVFVLGPAASSVIALTLAAGVAQTVVHAAGPGPMLLGAALAAAAAQGAVVAWVYRIGGAPIAAAALFPVGSAILARLLWEASADLRARRPITWAGREYVLEPR